MEHIKKGTFEGYLWKSDQQEPEIYTKGQTLPVLILKDEENPFIIEGQLIGSVKDETTGNIVRKSISIKYVDGIYKVKEYDVDNDCKSGVAIPRHFKGHSKLKGHNLLFYEVWQAKPDSNCCDMEVLEAKKVIFGGFE